MDINTPRQATASPRSEAFHQATLNAAESGAEHVVFAARPTQKTWRRAGACALSAALFATPAAAVTVGIGTTVDVPSSGTLTLTMDGGMLRLSSPPGSFGLSVSTTGAVLRRGMIYNAGTGLASFSLLGTTQLTGGPVGAPPADGMYLNASYFDSQGLDVINKGRIEQTGTGEFTLLGRTQLINDTGAVFSIQNDKGLKEFTGGSLNIVGFLNKGSFEKSGTTGASDILVPFDQQGGQVLLSSGILTFQRDGTHDSALFDADAAHTPGHTGYIEFGAAQKFGDVTTQAGAFVLDGSLELKQGKTWRQKGDFYAQGPITLGAASTLNNSGNLFLNAGAVAIAGPVPPTATTPGLPAATVTNSGSVRVTGTTAITNNGTLTNSGSLRLQESSSLGIGPGATVLNTGTLSGEDFSTITIASNGTLRNSGDLGTSRLVGAGTLENMPGGTFRGNISGAGQFFIGVSNRGQFTVGPDNLVTVGQFTNNAGTLTVDGRLDVFNGRLDLVGGTLNGTGVINGNVFVGGGPGTAIFVPGHSPGSMTINGSLSLLPGGVLELEASNVDGIVAADQLIVNGPTLLAGHISFLIGAGVTLDDLPDALLSCFERCIFSYDSTFSYDFPGRPGSQIELLDSEIRIVALGELGGVAPVPEPSIVMTMLAGVGAIGVVVRRRRGGRAHAAAQS